MPRDRSWVAFKLRSGARWHDGKPISVDDVIWTFNTLVTEGAPFLGFIMGMFKKSLKLAMLSCALTSKVLKIVNSRLSLDS